MRYPIMASIAGSLVFMTSVLLPCGVLAQGAGSDGEIAFSENSVQMRYIRETRAGVGGDPGELGFGLFLNETRDFVASANYYVDASRLRFNRLTIKVGPTAYAALLTEQNMDVFGVAIGAEARFELLRQPAVTLVGRAAYAPDILTFGAADNIVDIVGRVETPITDRITVFGGYRLFEVELLAGTNELEESLHLGMRYAF